MKPLNPFEIDLEKTTLIEASAGTGKTYTITTLYTRLVADGYAVESILVVTFTEAAAAELKIRIRRRIRRTLTGLSQPAEPDDDELVTVFRTRKDLSRVLLRLRAAVTSFDRASILTIHSFCLKTLRENAFESRSHFDIELVPDRALFLKQVCCDYFLSRINTLDPLFLRFLDRRQFTPDALSDLFSNLATRQDLHVVPALPEFVDRFGEHRRVVRQIHTLLLKESDRIIRLIETDPAIKKQSYSKRYVPVWLAQTRKKIDSEGENTVFKMSEIGDPIYKFTKTRMQSKTKQGESAPDHPFFDLCQTLLEIYQDFEQNLIHLKIGFLDYFKGELERIKQERSICFFDDLVNDLAMALDTPKDLDRPRDENPPARRTQKGKAQGPEQLIRAMQNSYKACLIDEFQDTDPIQYAIFSRVFAHPGTPFFMVGDPKQAIYAFRGGDIFAYLRAGRICEQRATLLKNYRSDPLLVAGIDPIFSRAENPFLFDAIGFTHVTAPASAADRLKKSGRSVPPVQFCLVPRSGQPLDRQGYMSKRHAEQLIPAVVAEDIVSLLGDPPHLKGKGDTPGRPLTPGDIAVLVRTNAQAEQIQQALTVLNIPSYLSSTGSVYDSRQAVELHDILWAVQHPDHKGYLKAALVTSVFGCTASDMAGLEKDEDLFFVWQQRFFQFKTLWETKGFVSMIMAVFHSEDAFLKGHPGLNERRMTNFYHLVELISQQALQKRLSPRFLFKWYVNQLSGKLREQAADELRLESDKKAVAIVTIHKSKGLEYPVVYLPYLWSGSGGRTKNHALFHDPEKDDRLTLDLGSHGLSKAMGLQEKEERAEQRRLLYVALTRASALCKIIWGGFKSVDTSALGQLLHPQGCKDDSVMTQDLEGLRSSAADSIDVYSASASSPGKPMAELPGENEPELDAKSLDRRIEPDWNISSFSAIIRSGAPHPFLEKPATKTGDQDRQGPGAPILEKRVVLSDFPKGAGAGDFFHSVYQEIDFTGEPVQLDELVATQAKRFGYADDRLIRAAGHSVRHVIGTPLFDNDQSFCLNQIPNRQRFNELEFSFTVQSFDMRTVQRAFELSDPLFSENGYTDQLGELSVNVFNGFIKGFIDLVIQHRGKWYILDYKTNYLGDRYRQYGRQDIYTAMADHHYFLQYHIYMVALHRYLTHRMKNYSYDSDMGGVFYLFVRGMAPELHSDYGVFFQRPASASIEHLSDTF
ncbi:MAG: UvrD-helicase domain-containing protein [Desulfobacterales bacterium]|nr:UvrD-helicase domain-containing protein [Desulfobacterales bacterium]